MTTGYEVLLENAETRYNDEIESIAKDLWATSTRTSIDAWRTTPSP